MADSNSPVEGGTESQTTVDRRRVLKGIGTAAIAGTGVSAVAGSAAAQVGIQVINVDDGWFGWSADGSLPVEEELLVFAHGWFGDTTVTSQASDVLDSVEQAGYSPDATVAIEWPATTTNYVGAESDTAEVGAVVADLIEEFKDSGGGQVRLTGHSLGGRVVYETANAIGGGYEIDTIGAMGTAADGSNVCSGGEWYDGVANNAGEVRNYHSGNDSTVGSAYGGLGDTALGTDGAGCGGASNYTDVDVTYSVGGHLEYLGDSSVGDDLATVILNDDGGDDGGDGGDGGDDGGDDCWWWC